MPACLRPVLLAKLVLKAVCHHLVGAQATGYTAMDTMILAVHKSEQAVGFSALMEEELEHATPTVLLMSWLDG